MTDAPDATVLLLIGISGVGKTTVGRAVAERLGWDFFDADDLHPPENVAKMERGVGLTDHDRGPWLAAVRALIERRLAAQTPAVIACSALKTAYRERLRGDDAAVRIVWLDADSDLVAERLSARKAHFAGPSLLKSQLDTLELPSEREHVVRVSAVGSVDDVSRRVVDALAEKPPLRR